jgi:hypothetical protein
MKRVADPGTDGQRVYVAQLPRKFGWYANQVIFTYGDNLDRVGEPEISRICMRVRRKEALRCLRSESR